MCIASLLDLKIHPVVSIASLLFLVHSAGPINLVSAPALCVTTHRVVHVLRLEQAGVAELGGAMPWGLLKLGEQSLVIHQPVSLSGRTVCLGVGLGRSWKQIFATGMVVD